MKSENIKLPTQILKRDGRKVKFDPTKITQAIFKAFEASKEFGNEKQNLEEAERLTPIAVDLFTHTINSETPTVETMQDVVEQVLMAAGHYQTAKAYIIYRAEHEGQREAKQITGVEDDLGLTINQLKVIESRYLRHDEDGNPTETPKQLFTRVAKAIADNEKTGEKKFWEQKYANIMENFEFVPSGGYLRSAGTKNPMLANCFVLPIEDSMTGIFDSVKWMALIHQKGGGTGFNFTPLRPKGDLVNTSGGFSSGPISFMKVFDAATRQVMQGGFKRGANMGILNVDHPDILDFITCKTEEDEITNFNISVGISDKFMQAVKKDKDFDLINPRNGEVVQSLSARNLYSQIVTLAWRTGDPGVIFLDAINRNNPLLEKLGPMITTNPCITGDTLISTEEGLFPLSLLKSKKIKVATDQRVISQNSEVKHFPISAFYNQGKKQVYRLTTKSGFQLKGTADHKIMTTKGFVKLKDLKDHKILLQPQASGFNQNENLPFKSEILSLPKTWNKQLGQVLGWLIGDGWLRNGDKNCRIGFVFSQKDKNILNLLKPFINQIYGKEIDEIKRENEVFHLSYHSQFFVDFFQNLGVKSVKAEEKLVPDSIFTAPKDSIIGFLQGLFSADGTVGLEEPKGNYYIRLTSKSEKLLKGVQLLLLNFGIRSSIYNRSREARETFSYQNKKGEEKNYQSDGILFELNISKINLKIFLDEIGFLTNKHQEKINQLKNIKFKPEDFTDQVLSIEKLGLEEVFDITENITHSFIAGGIVVSNCGEQPLHPFDVCNLGSINLSQFYLSQKPKTYNLKPETCINWKRLDEVIRLAVRFLDNGVDISTYPIPQVTEMAQANRRIGLGVMGWADLLFKLEIPYNSQKASDLATKISQFFYSVTHNESEKLGKEKGVFPNWKGSSYETKNIKQRNLAITTIAPTGTISMVSNCSSGIEPVFLLSYTKNVVDDAGLIYINPIFEKALEENIKEEDLRQEIIKKVAKTGTCQNIDELPDKIKKVFVTAHDINWQDHVRMQSAFQLHTDNAVSKTINFPHDASLGEVEKAYMMAWELGCKGLTIYRDGSKSMQILEVNKEKKALTLNSKKKKKETIIQSKIKVKSLKQRMTETKNQELRIKNHEKKEKPKNLNPDNLNPDNLNPNSCPECGSALQASEGCSTCLNCGYSKCSL